MMVAYPLGRWVRSTPPGPHRPGPGRVHRGGGGVPHVGRRAGAGAGAGRPGPAAGRGGPGGGRACADEAVAVGPVLGHVDACWPRRGAPWRRRPRRGGCHRRAGGGGGGERRPGGAGRGGRGAGGGAGRRHARVRRRRCPGAGRRAGAVGRAGQPARPGPGAAGEGGAGRPRRSLAREAEARLRCSGSAPGGWRSGPRLSEVAPAGPSGRRRWPSSASAGSPCRGPGSPWASATGTPARPGTWSRSSSPGRAGRSTARCWSRRCGPTRTRPAPAAGRRSR